METETDLEKRARSLAMKIWLRILFDEGVLSFFQDLEELNRLSSQIDVGMVEERIRGKKGKGI